MIQDAPTVADRLRLCESRLQQWRQHAVMTEWVDPALVAMVEGLVAELSSVSARQSGGEGEGEEADAALRELEERMNDTAMWFGVPPASARRRSLSFGW